MDGKRVTAREVYPELQKMFGLPDGCGLVVITLDGPVNPVRIDCSFISTATVKAGPTKTYTLVETAHKRKKWWKIW